MVRVTRRKLWFYALLILTLRTTVAAVEINGTISGSREKAASVETESDLLPSRGDKVTIYFKLPGTDDEVSVGEGRVSQVNSSAIEIDIENATGAIEKGHLVRITSERPTRRSKDEPREESPIVAVTPTSSPSPAARKSSPSPAVKEEKKPRAPAGS